MIVLGGATRLTGSGLSIMEWAPISGALPPLSEADWNRLFRLYQRIPQYKLVNAEFGLAEFKRIFWLEWVHRLWGRLIGLALVMPLVFFGATGRLSRALAYRLAALLVLGGLQGAVGWFMVASGFTPDSISVSAYRLVLHLDLALALYAAVLWTALSTLRPNGSAAAETSALRGLTLACCAGVALSITAGGVVAGTHAGLTYNTFPLMDGSLIPPGYAALRPALLNLTENLAAIQFNHRLLATVTAVLAGATLVAGFRLHAPRSVRLALAALAALVGFQYGLGILTLLHVVPVGLAVAHQAVAVLVLTASVVALHLLRPSHPPPLGRTSRCAA